MALCLFNGTCWKTISGVSTLNESQPRPRSGEAVLGMQGFFAGVSIESSRHESSNLRLSVMFFFTISEKGLGLSLKRARLPSWAFFISVGGKRTFSFRYELLKSSLR
jgi:hypothetical protein